MNKKYILALDSGTTSARAVLFDKKANVMSIGQNEFTQYFPEPGWVEHDANEIYANQVGVVIQAIQKNHTKLSEIEAIGITNQRETVVIWDKRTGIPVHHAIVWQDKRTADYCEKLANDPKVIKIIKEKTGLVLDPYFSGTKIKWLLDNVKGLRNRAEKGEVLAGTIDTWLIWKLTNGKSFVTDYTNASRTLLFNIINLKWDQELLKLFDIPEKILPEVKNSSDNFGTTDIDAFKGIPIYSSIGDQQSSLFGHRSKIGELKGTYGTGAFLMLNTGEKVVRSKNGLLTTIALGLNGKVTYALEGSIYIAGNALKWIKDELHLIQEYEQIDYYLKDNYDTKGVTVVPYFVGVGSPYWNTKARGLITGITRGTNRGDIIRATAASIAFQTYDIFKAFQEDYNSKIIKMSIDGGVSKTQNLMQLQSNILEAKLYNPESSEITALGAAFLAGLKAKFWKDQAEIDKLIKFKKIYKPNAKVSESEKIIKNWKESVRLALEWNKTK
ncbi:Glycerol kinase [Candidatus Hepatoplasma crinochetorum Av]|uniref:ATP:glycerol 3-phosphotransferase n=1 Tax=Candidatus Hepatoplasma crinochetorum Av TaxID=1427984 RepID=W8GJJ5_9MOLU|nr:glycerol kinase GlpK [Candidatus Hepatoplasma crinochetorum]AHK22387.1 Glycerol kinase [Candidatus Hepatoplasma crinochetorum Av]